jgi:hypothetical protein
MELSTEQQDDRDHSELTFPRDAQPVGNAMRQISGPLLRQIRRFQTLETCLKALPPKLMGLCAPLDIKIVPGREPDAESLSTVYWLIASETVEAALEARKRELLQQINSGSVQLVEEFRYEVTSSEHIREQLNILSARPD